MPNRQKFIVTVEQYEGENSGIILSRDGETPSDLGVMYCVGALSSDGIIDLVDCGYESIGELLEAWPTLVTPELARAQNAHAENNWRG